MTTKHLRHGPHLVATRQCRAVYENVVVCAPRRNRAVCRLLIPYCEICFTVSFSQSSCVVLFCVAHATLIHCAIILIIEIFLLCYLRRPTFSAVENWMEAIILHLECGLPLPSEVEFSLLPKSLSKVPESK